MAKLRWRKKAVLGKVESTYGVDASPAGATDAMLVIASDVSLTPIQADQVPRDVVRASGERGAFAAFLVGKHVQLEFSIEMAGSGAVDTAPAYAPLLRGCALAETVNATTSVQYDPVSASEESVTLYLHIDGVLHKLLGARGNVSFELTVGQVPRLRFRFLGLFAAVADAAFPPQTLTSFRTPLPATKVNTPTTTLHAAAVKLQSVSVDLGNDVQHRELTNSEETVVVDRRSSGQITFEAADVATKDWWGAVTGETQAALQVVHGTVAGDKAQIDAPKVQLVNPRLSESQDIAMLTLDLIPVPNAGDDEIRYTTL